MKKKILTVVSALVLVVVMLASLCACGSSWNGIKKASEKEGYEETEASSVESSLVKTFLGEDAEEAVTIHVMKKGLSVAVIIEFKSTKKMEEMLADKVDKEDAKNIYDELQKLDFVNGNCVYVGLAGADIFKSTK